MPIPIPLRFPAHVLILILTFTGLLDVVLVPDFILIPISILAFSSGCFSYSCFCSELLFDSTSDSCCYPLRRRAFVFYIAADDFEQESIVGELKKWPQNENCSDVYL
jgi:hypothetical protein